jgi:serine/threonine protein kinase
MTRPLSDAALGHLRAVGRIPDLGTPRYRIRELLGRGGMGTVWLADDLELQRPVAIKIVNEGSTSPEIAARFVQEARIVAQLEHPGIVPVHAVGTTPDGRVFYVMKRVRGMRIDEAARLARPLAWKLGLFQRVCETVAFAHAAGVLHRDLKPENVMVGEFGEVLVLDWGVAKRLAATPECAAARGSEAAPAGAADAADPLHGVRTRGGLLVGTPAYMAPEQRRGESHRLSFQTDVYALGALLYVLLAGRAPAFGPPPDVLQPPRRLDPRIPAPLESICVRAMAASPGDRYPGALALAADVDRFLAGERVQAHPEGWEGRLRRLLVRYRTPILVVVGYLVVRLVLLWASGR